MSKVLKFSAVAVVLGGLFSVAIGGNLMATPLPKNQQNTKTAVFAGGCFWCMQSEFDSEKGVLETTVGYTGGTKPNPTYEEVSTGKSGHREAIQVTYDPHIVTYPRLLEIFWSNVDPLDAKGQFCDKGEQYKAGIYVEGDEERAAAQASAVTISKKLKQPVVTDILTRAPFYTAEEYHQDYYKKSAARYAQYRAGCGRDQRLEQLKELGLEDLI
ncbi:MAG: peptide-methionine (S)-S-oxide reductase [Pseudomonas fluorescens]|nr:MAG: peptide-methionine (S)-S-oxide reductase [Pseudomonas fluorescens]